MLTIKKTLLASSITIATAFSGSALAEEKSFMEAMKDGKTSLSFRFRVEDVSQDTNDGATATTLQTRLNYKTGAYKGFSGFIEFDQVSELIEVDYNTGPGGTSYEGKAAILDPEGTDLNQAYAQYTFGKNTVKYGRQRILLDDQRFVGGVGFRQNEQTYDATSFTGQLGDVNVFGAYVSNVNRIFGDDRAPAGDNDNATILLNAKYKIGDIGSLTGYKYIIDNKDLTAFSTDTTGIRFSGSTSGLGYTLEYATQSDTADAPVEYTASFIAAEGSYSIKPVKLTLGYQNLGADGAGFFKTPLATLHKFQGWTDMFLNGGSGNVLGGIEDIYGSAGGKFGPVSVTAVYHKFGSDDAAAAGGVDNYGSEWGVVVGGSVGSVNLTAKYASFSADDDAMAPPNGVKIGGLQDTTKLWLQATLAF